MEPSEPATPIILKTLRKVNVIIRKHPCFSQSKARQLACILLSLQPHMSCYLLLLTDVYLLRMCIKFEEAKQCIQITHQLNHRSQMQSGRTMTSQDTVSILSRLRMESLCPSRARWQNLHLKMCPVPTIGHSFCELWVDMPGPSPMLQYHEALPVWM